MDSLTPLNVTELREEARARSGDTFATMFNLFLNLVNMFAPYIPEDNFVFNFARNYFEDTVSTFRGAIARVDPGTTPTAGIVAIGAGAVAGPYIVQVIKSVLASIYGFFDNIYFVATGRAISRRSITDEMLNQFLEATIERIVK